MALLDPGIFRKEALKLLSGLNSQNNNADVVKRLSQLWRLDRKAGELPDEVRSEFARIANALNTIRVSNRVHDKRVYGGPAPYRQYGTNVGDLLRLDYYAKGLRDQAQMFSNDADRMKRWMIGQEPAPPDFGMRSNPRESMHNSRNLSTESRAGAEIVDAMIKLFGDAL
jgi:hypothetical protein